MLSRRMTLALGAALLAATACQPAEDAGDAEDGPVEVTAKDFEFEAPAEIPAGWTDFRFVNAGEEEHFFMLWRLPEGKTAADYKKDVVAAFERVFNRYASGKLDRKEALQALGEEVAPWFFEGVVPSGGAALTEPGDTSRVTLEMEPGTYVLECYVKTPKGTFHVGRGMLRQLRVIAGSGGGEPPRADAELTLSNYRIAAPDRLEAGTHTLAVRVAEDPEGLLAHDVNLFRLDDEAGAEEIAAWMDWMDLDQFRAPAPGHSLGGVEHLPAGRTGYMTVTLEPGRYAWVSEGYAARGMVSTFTVE